MAERMATATAAKPGSRRRADRAATTMNTASSSSHSSREPAFPAHTAEMVYGTDRARELCANT